MRMDETPGALPRYLRNQDVVLREEAEDGALLFNPDTDQIRVLNATGLFLWKLCDGGNGLPGLVEAMKKAFDQVPEQEAAGQVSAFMDDMLASGFVGAVGE
jgi:hypothetical protein